MLATCEVAADYICDGGLVGDGYYDREGCQIVEVAACHRFVMSMTAVVGVEGKITRNQHARVVAPPSHPYERGEACGGLFSSSLSARKS